VSAEFYRLNAAQCVQTAHKTNDAEAKLALLDMAKAWLALADQADKNSMTELVYETPAPPQRVAQQQQQQQQPQPDNDKK